MKTKNRIKENQGITLIALIVTIVILIILVGVSMAMLLGDNGLINKSEEGGEIYQNASEEELENLNELGKELGDIIDDIGIFTPNGTVEFSDTTWSNNKAQVTLSTETNYEIQYQINGTDEENWQIGNQVSELKLNDVVFARLWNGTTGGDSVSKTILDEIDPNEANIVFDVNNTHTGENIKATVTQNDEQSGVNIENCMWTFNMEEKEIGLDSSKYDNNFKSNPEELIINKAIPGIYYLHVLTVDYAGRAKETISGPVQIVQLVTGIIMDKTNSTIDVGKTLQINATVNPENANNKSITWTSSNESVATVNQNGLVTGKTGGVANIIAKSNDGSNIQATCVVKVNAMPVITNTSFNNKTTTSISINTIATDLNGGNLTYKLYVSTSNNGGWQEKAVVTAPQNTMVTLTAGGLANYASYYYYIWVTDGRLATQTGVFNAIRTFCPGTGLVCNGPFTTQVNCSACRATGAGYAGHMWRSGADAGYTDETTWICMVCGHEFFKYVGVRKVGREIPGHICDYCGCIICELKPGDSNPQCPNCNSVAVRSKFQFAKTGKYIVLIGDNTCFSKSIKCSTCGGTGKITQNINCIHGRNSSHGYCVHGQLGQHD